MTPQTDQRGWAIWSGIAGVLFLIVAILGGTRDLSHVLSLVAGVLFMIISIRSLPKARHC